MNSKHNAHYFQYLIKIKKRKLIGECRSIAFISLSLLKVKNLVKTDVYQITRQRGVWVQRL